MAKRNYPLPRIKYWRTYTIEEICALYKELGLHNKTVRKWMRNGLETIDNKRPILIYGETLREFLGKMNVKGKCSTKFDEMFCMKCRDAKPFFQKKVQLIHRGKSLNARALCRTCKTPMQKGYRLTDIPKIRDSFNVVGVLTLNDSEPSSVNAQLEEAAQTNLNEPTQWRLFDD